MGMDATAQEGLRWRVSGRQVLFYADDGYLGSTDREWLQAALDALIPLFERVGLKTNVAKTKSMVCFPGTIRHACLAVAYKRRMDGVGPSYRARKRQRLSCDICGKEMAANSLMKHMQMQHGTEPAFEVPVEEAPQPTCIQFTYPDGEPGTRHECPMPDCSGTFTDKATLRRDFSHRHRGVVVHLTGESSLAMCSLRPIDHADGNSTKLR